MEPEAKPIAIVLAVYFVGSVLAACTVLRENNAAPPANGLVMNHPVHIEQGMDCSDCHDFAAGPEFAVAGHDTCVICHEIPENEPTAQSCRLCHTRDDHTVNPRLAWLTEEVKFDHQIHAAAEVDCMQCHADLDGGGGRRQLTMNFCMDCHAGKPHSGIAASDIAQAAFGNNECAVCHKELDADAVPLFRDGHRIAHDSPDVWMQLHGMESHVDPRYCMICHTEQEDCQTCHQIMAPASHTPAWTRRLHGLQARWDRQSCAACHEEESCSQCHMTTAPTSHRGSFTRGMSTHCVQCHFPARDDCAICHESAPHFTAPASPHNGDFSIPPNCAACHPGGIPGEPPHLLNLSSECNQCHR